MNKYDCRICGNTTLNKTFLVEEKKYGSHRNFEYLQCSCCGTIQRADLSIDISEFYPSQYYSMNSIMLRILKSKRQSSAILRSLLKKFLFIPSLYRTGTYKFLRRIELIDLRLESIGKISLDSNSKILDIGSGSGTLLFKLRLLGFNNLEGMDPYIPSDFYSEHISLIKSDILNIESEKKYDCIIFYHSLEHVDDPLNTLKKAKELINDGGTIVVAIPILNFAFEKYALNWLGLDAPVHNHLFTFKGFEKLLVLGGLKMKYYYFNSQSTQFYVSEKYSLNRSYSLVGFPQILLYTFLKLFSPKVRRFRILSSKLNREGNGDQAVFYISK